MTEQFSNLAITTLSSGVDDSQTTIPVVSVGNFPTQGQFRILIDSEILIVTALSGTTWTVTRGAESTTPASHPANATVAHVLTAGSLQAAIDQTTPSIVRDFIFALGLGTPVTTGTINKRGNCNA